MRCTRCILPDTVPNIAFDEAGVCNYCRTYHRYSYKGESELLSLLDAHRGKGDRYDCLVGISGGRDSSYVLLKVAKDYGMRALAVNYDNPFADSQARANVESAVRALNVDLVRFQLKNHIHERTFKHGVATWSRRPSPASVGMMCIACKMMNWNLLKIAKEHGIGCIVLGGNPFEYTSFKKELLHVSRDEDWETAFMKYIKGILREVAKNPGYLSPICIPTMITGYLFGNPYAIGPRLLGRNVAWIDLFHYIAWDEQTVLSRIRSELNWDHPRSLNSTWRFDCRIQHLKDFMYMKTIGVMEREDFYAKMVREGLMAREEALARLEKENRLHPDEVRLLLSQVGIHDIPFLDESGGSHSAHTEAQSS